MLIVFHVSGSILGHWDSQQTKQVTVSTPVELISHVLYYFMVYQAFLKLLAALILSIGQIFPYNDYFTSNDYSIVVLNNTTMSIVLVWSISLNICELVKEKKNCPKSSYSLD